jgi:hypothetical protein
VIIEIRVITSTAPVIRKPARETCVCPTKTRRPAPFKPDGAGSRFSEQSTAFPLPSDQPGVERRQADGGDGAADLVLESRTELNPSGPVWAEAGFVARGWVGWWAIG